MANNKPAYDYLVKLIIIGDSGVGKTCFLLRFAEDSFATSHITTIGIDFKIKTMTFDNKKVKLQIWDTAGQERFQTITQTYYKGAMGIFLLYDCTDEKSFNHIRSWVKQIELHANPNVVKVLVGNKSDKPEKVITTEQGRALAEEFKMGFFEASAKSNINVKESFEHLAQEIFKRGIESSLSKVVTVTESQNNDGKSASCCGSSVKK